ncbi:hypothetical protein F7725_028865 [Dissostichus mawsoni]|uniref:Uncharacterized protein n=1 Tax=Dissostichus mawsoni TaxID=36200 RepID=A0A7J5XI93_DISMA|nr:hypothetical protein F7725_028865 [Dissostichus mawsoni]
MVEGFTWATSSVCSFWNMRLRASQANPAMSARAFIPAMRGPMRMYEADGALGYGVVLVAQCCQDARQVSQRRNLVSQLALRAEQTHCCRGNCLQGLTLQGLQEGHQELSRLAQHPAGLSNKDAQEDSTNF